MYSRAHELAEIDRYISTRGLTRCPSTFVTPSPGLSRQEAERIVALPIERPLTHAESVEMAKPSMFWLFR
jgi:hypothetical protein